MKKRIVGLILLCMLFISLSVSAISFSAEEKYNSVVVIYSGASIGTGFAIEENLIVTNAHVVGDNHIVKVKMYDGSTISGQVIRVDAFKDIALISISKNIAPLTVNTEEPGIGREVYAIGTPRDMPYTMTKGIISALNRNIGGNYYIQIDASINAGNSGGPLVDENGAVIGVITMKSANAEGIGFAIYMRDVMTFSDGAEPVSPPENDSEITYDNGASEFSESELLIEENNRLKIIVCISVVLNIIFVLFLVFLLCKNKKEKKDEFDFEIEIEE